MQNVHFVIGHKIKNPFDVIHAEEMARHIKHEAAPYETRVIPYRSRCDPPRTGLYIGRFDIDWQ